MINFWTRLDSLLEAHKIVIDRPKGCRHPRFPELVYPLDYGYLEETSGGDGDGIDAWRGSMPPIKRVAIACTVDLSKRDAEIKLLVGCTEEEINIINSFLNGDHSMSGIIVTRDERL